MIYLTLFLTFLQIGAQYEPYSATLHTARRCTSAYIPLLYQD